MKRLPLVVLLCAAAGPTRAGTAGDQLCNAAGQSSGCLDTSWPGDSYHPPRDREPGGGGQPDEPPDPGCPECRAETLRRLEQVPEMKAPTWSDADLRDARLASVLRDDQDAANRLSPLLAADAGCSTLTLWGQVRAFAGEISCPAPCPAPPVPPLPYTEAMLTTNFVDPHYPNRYKDQNSFNHTIFETYRKLWKTARYRAALNLINPIEFKAILGHESDFRAAARRKCAYLAKGCSRKGVGIGQLTLISTKDVFDQMKIRLVIDKKHDDRLDPAKEILAALALIVRDHNWIKDATYASKQAIPDPAVLRELTVLAYKTSPRHFGDAINLAAKLDKKSFADVRLVDILKKRDGKPGTLARQLTLPEQKEFDQATGSYVQAVRELLPADDPLRGGQ